MHLRDSLWPLASCHCFALQADLLRHLTAHLNLASIFYLIYEYISACHHFHAIQFATPRYYAGRVRHTLKAWYPPHCPLQQRHASGYNLFHFWIYSHSALTLYYLIIIYPHAHFHYALSHNTHAPSPAYPRFLQPAAAAPCPPSRVRYHITVSALHHTPRCLTTPTPAIAPRAALLCALGPIC